MKFQVIITPSAKADIFEINTRLLENYPNIAEKLTFRNQPSHRVAYKISRTLSDQS